MEGLKEAIEFITNLKEGSMEPPITASIKPTIRNAEAKLKFISYPDYFLNIPIRPIP